MKNQKPWLRAVLEGALIVTSILLAFGIDAWWADRQERRESLRLLEGLHGDFAANRAALSETIQFQEGIVDRLARLDGMSETDLDRTPSDSVDGFVFAVQAPWTFDGQSGTLEALIASGRLSILKVPGLSAALLNWKARVEDLEEEKIATRAISDAARHRTAQLGGPWGTQDLAVKASMEEALRQLPPPDLALVATDAELRALLREKRVLSIIYLAELIPLLEQTDSILDILEDSRRW
jgi:hypothetical protein